MAYFVNENKHSYRGLSVIAGTNPTEDPRVTALLAALEQADHLLAKLAANDPRRPELISRILAMEDALDGLGDDV